MTKESNSEFIDLGYYIQKEVCRYICIKQWFYKHMNPKFHTWEVKLFMWEGRKKFFFSSFNKKPIPQSSFFLSLDGRMEKNNFDFKSTTDYGITGLNTLET